MIRLLLVSPNLDLISSFAEFFKMQPKISVLKAESGSKALDLIVTEKLDLVIAAEDLHDMDCLEFVKKMTLVNPMINCALIGSMAGKAFHEVTEGMGILKQLSPVADEEQLGALLIQLQSIIHLTGDQNR